jgi:hypothetical protein
MRNERIYTEAIGLILRKRVDIRKPSIYWGVLCRNFGSVTNFSPPGFSIVWKPYDADINFAIITRGEKFVTLTVSAKIRREDF